MSISKELLSEVIGDNLEELGKINYADVIIAYEMQNVVIYVDNSRYISGCNIKKEYKSINIYELAHKCKEWAKGKGFQILSGVDNANTYRADVYYTDLLISDFETIKNTEPEAIFKACEWILEHKEIK